MHRREGERTERQADALQGHHIPPGHPELQCVSIASSAVSLVCVRARVCLLLTLSTLPQNWLTLQVLLPRGEPPTVCVLLSRAALAVCQGGDYTKGNGTGGESIFGEKFEDVSYSQLHHLPRRFLARAAVAPSWYFSSSPGATHALVCLASNAPTASGGHIK